MNRRLLFWSASQATPKGILLISVPFGVSTNQIW